MSTGNFYYENRCIVVTEDDFENGNLPALTKNWNRSRNYPGRELDHDLNLSYHEIYLISGYYEAACIDFQEIDSYSIEDQIGYYVETKKDYINEIKDITGLSFYRIKKLLPAVKSCIDFDTWLTVANEIIDNYLKDLEADIINKYLDQLKVNNGYKEYGTFCRFSNGETWYREIS